MSRLSPQQKKNRAALLALGHNSVASAITEIRRAMPSFDKRGNYPKIHGICPPLADIVLHVRDQKILQFDHETGFVSGNRRRAAARGTSHHRGGDFTPGRSNVWQLNQ